MSELVKVDPKPILQGFDNLLDAIEINQVKEVVDLYDAYNLLSGRLREVKKALDTKVIEDGKEYSTTLGSRIRSRKKSTSTPKDDIIFDALSIGESRKYFKKNPFKGGTVKKSLGEEYIETVVTDVVEVEYTTPEQMKYIKGAKNENN